MRRSLAVHHWIEALKGVKVVEPKISWQACKRNTKREERILKIVVIKTGQELFKFKLL